MTYVDLSSEIEKMTSEFSSLLELIRIDQSRPSIPFRPEWGGDSRRPLQ